MKPFYRRFKGSIIEEGDDIKARFRTVGCAEVISDNTIKVTELPIHTWTENYKASIKSDELVKSVEEEEENEDADIKLTITLRENDRKVAEKLSKLRMDSLLSPIFVLHDSENKLREFESANEIIQEFFDYRLSCYEARLVRFIATNFSLSTFYLI